MAISPPTHGAALPAKPTTTDSIPSLTDLTTQATTKPEPRLYATLLSTVGSVSKAHESTIRGLLITLFLAILIAHYYLLIVPAILDAATRSEAGVTLEGGVKVFELGNARPMPLAGADGRTAALPPTMVGHD